MEHPADVENMRLGPLVDKPSRPAPEHPADVEKMHRGRFVDKPSRPEPEHAAHLTPLIPFMDTRTLATAGRMCRKSHAALAATVDARLKDFPIETAIATSCKYALQCIYRHQRGWYIPNMVIPTDMLEFLHGCGADMSDVMRWALREGHTEMAFRLHQYGFPRSRPSHIDRYSNIYSISST
jgi:hypothetical protein